MTFTDLYKDFQEDDRPPNSPVRLPKDAPRYLPASSEHYASPPSRSPSHRKSSAGKHRLPGKRFSRPGALCPHFVHQRGKSPRTAKPTAGHLPVPCLHTLLPGPLRQRTATRSCQAPLESSGRQRHGCHRKSLGGMPSQRHRRSPRELAGGRPILPASMQPPVLLRFLPDTVFQ